MNFKFSLWILSSGCLCAAPCRLPWRSTKWSTRAKGRVWRSARPSWRSCGGRARAASTRPSTETRRWGWVPRQRAPHTSCPAPAPPRLFSSPVCEGVAALEALIQILVAAHFAQWAPESAALTVLELTPTHNLLLLSVVLMEFLRFSEGRRHADLSAMKPPTGQGRQSEQLDTEIPGNYCSENVGDYTKPCFSTGWWRPNSWLSRSFVGCCIVF